jgi:signal transduction histidine kinase
MWEWFAVEDDGAAAPGHGFLNMRDRLGAIGGELSVESAPGQGTRVRGSIPAAPPPQAGLSPPPWTAAAGA